MGTKNLWKLLNRAGEKCTDIKNKKIAIDISIWAHNLKNIPIEKIYYIFIRRIFRLLISKNKLIFVFDGGIPTAKKETVILRKKQEEINDRKRFFENKLCKKCNIVFNQCEHGNITYEFKKIDEISDDFVNSEIRKSKVIEKDAKDFSIAQFNTYKIFLEEKRQNEKTSKKRIRGESDRYYFLNDNQDKVKSKSNYTEIKNLIGSEKSKSNYTEIKNLNGSEKSKSNYTEIKNLNGSEKSKSNYTENQKIFSNFTKNDVNINNIKQESTKIGEDKTQQPNLSIKNDKILNMTQKNIISNIITNIDETISLMKNILRNFNIDYIEAPLEADAQCAALFKFNIVDCIISDDNDILMYGGDHLYKNWTKNEFVYFSMKNIKEKLNFTADDLINITYYLGGDYNLGVENIGIKKAEKLIRTEKIKNEKLLNLFHDPISLSRDKLIKNIKFLEINYEKIERFIKNIFSDNSRYKSDLLIFLKATRK